MFACDTCVRGGESDRGDLPLRPDPDTSVEGTDLALTGEAPPPATWARFSSVFTAFSKATVRPASIGKNISYAALMKTAEVLNATSARKRLYAILETSSHCGFPRVER